MPSLLSARHWRGQMSASSRTTVRRIASLTWVASLGCAGGRPWASRAELGLVGSELRVLVRTATHDISTHGVCTHARCIARACHGGIAGAMFQINDHIMVCPLPSPPRLRLGCHCSGLLCHRVALSGHVGSAASSLYAPTPSPPHRRPHPAMAKSAKARQMDAQSRADIKHDKQDRLDKAKATKTACLKAFNRKSKQVAFRGLAYTPHPLYSASLGVPSSSTRATSPPPG